jgi:hypothetical protein
MRKSGFLIALLAAAIAGCGGGDPADDAFQPGQTPTTPASTVSSLTLTTDTPTVPSAGNAAATIRAFARDSSNRLMSGIPITFSASSGALNVVQSTTDAGGVASATLTPLTPESRNITVTANAGATTAQIVVAVDGTTIDIQGPDSLITATPGTFTVTLTDSADHAVIGQSVTITSQPASTLSAGTVTTDANGRATFTMTPTSAAAVTLTATGAGETKLKTVAVSADSFAFTTPAADTKVQLNAPGVQFTVNWLSGGAAIPNGQTVNFSTTRGMLSASSGITAGGQASVTLQSTTAGEAVVTATNASGGSTQRRVIFVASQAASASLQANPFTVAINQSTTLTATIRDASNNLVAGKTVVFSLNDATGGSLSVGSAVTDSQGRARTVYTASSTTSATNGVHVTVTVQDTPSVTAAVDLTVAGSPLFLAFGTGNEIQQINSDTQYRVNYVVQVTDANSSGVPGAPVTLSALHWDYVKGQRVAGATSWGTVETAVCTNEDRLTGTEAYDFNGVLDPGENQNGTDPQGNLTLESGNIAAVSPGSGVTDANGFLNFSITYPQNYAGYIYLVLRAKTGVQGTEFSRTSLPFVLQGAASDYNNIQVAPPGLESPFGTGGNCGDFN